MNKLIGSILIVFSIWMQTSFCIAQTVTPIFNHLTVNEGLSSNRIWGIFRDSKDYLWMSTDVGLDKYDSYQIKKYRFDEKSSGTISSNNITCMYEDRTNQLWFGTVNGLNLYDPSKDYFKVFKNDSTDKNSISGNYISSILEDHEGTLWIVTDGNCLNSWDPKTQTFKQYRFEDKKNNLYAHSSRQICNDSKGYIWIVSFGRGILRFEHESGKFTRYDDPSIDFGTNCYKSLYIDNQDKIWIVTDGNGFFSYDPETSRFEQFGSNGDGFGTNRKNILDIIPEDDRYILLAVDQGGINRFDKISKKFDYIMFDPTIDNGLNNNGIWCFHKDREGILWIGTSGGGINYLNPKKEQFKLFKHTSNPNSLSYNFTGCLFEDYLGLIWIGTDGGGVNTYDPKTGMFKSYTHEPANPYSLSGNVIRSIVEDKDHDVWIATWDAGLNRYDRKTGRFYHYLPEQDNPFSISTKSVWNAAIAHNGTMWLSINNVGIDLFDKQKGVIKRFRPDPANPKTISSNECWLFFEDPAKNMWIGTEHGLNRYDSLTSTFKIYNFPENTVGAFHIDSAGNLWVGTYTKGLYFCSPEGEIIKTYDTSNGLPNNTIKSIVEDDHGNLWITSNSGISRLNRNTEKIRNYSKEDGLQGDQFFQQSFLKTRSGEIYFGGYNGFNSFHPDKLKDNTFIPQVHITDFQIFNKHVTSGISGSQFETHISEAKEITLHSDQSVFSFSFAAINYTHPEKNQYAYMMEGFEKDWNYTDATRRYTTYTNLDPGEYTFRVKASNNDGIWNENGHSVRIVILPPWWNTWWFKLIVISAVIFVLASIYLSRVRNLQKQKILLEKLVAIKTTELHELNASKDKFFSIIAHDLKNPFNSIIGFSEILQNEIKSKNYEVIEEFAGLINISAVQAMRLLENLLAWANSQRGKIVFNPETINLYELLEEEYSMLNDLAKSKNILLKTAFPENITIVADKNMLKTILRNLISNAIKFTPKNGKIDVKASMVNQFLEISVSDNGIGMTREAKEKLFKIDTNQSTYGTENEKGTGLGLILCKEFIEKHHGQIWVESEPGKGSEFKFRLPIS
ncbi:MAG: two-component regulator propeller domain-containing protein [Prolixibacteraceae bacterium]